MTVSAQLNSFGNLPAFKSCSEATLHRLRDEGRIISFSIGHALCSSAIVPNRVLVILSGNARLLGQHNGQLNTLAMQGPGNLEGLPSLLRAEGCEEVSAATAVEAWALPDALVAEIYASESGFRAWCHTTVFPAELAGLVDALLSQSERAPFGLLDVLGKVMPKARALEGTDDAFNALEETQQAFVASANSSAALNHALDTGTSLPRSQGAFALRLLSLPRAVVDQIRAGRSRASNNTTTSETPEAVGNTASNEADVIAKLPARSSLDLKGKDPLESLNLITGTGALHESMACFRMLAQLMGLPFRRDALEKTIRDALRRGKQPNLPMLGQLVAGMGLHASGAKVSATLCTRMNVPCLIAWDEGFGVVVRSDSNGLLVAHPRLGWLELSPEQVAADAPDGFDVILVDRTSATPNAKFNFGWFLPAIKRYRSTLLLVLGSSFVVQLFTLANPLLIQVIIDKVISQRSLDTLQVLGIALVAVTIFEGLLGSLRTFLFADTTNRIDMRLGAEVIDHLLRLPVGYFDRRPVGELGTRIAELEKIRNFLTGEALTTIIDAAFSVIYILVMASTAGCSRWSPCWWYRSK